MKIGILTYHSSHNYGAFLQAYALSNALRRDRGQDVEIIDFSMKKANDFYLQERQNENPKKKQYLEERYRMFEESKKKYLALSDRQLVSDDIEEFAQWVNGCYDVIVAGSDEIWKLDGLRGFPTPYWLPKVKDCRKMSYAASSRSNPAAMSEEVRSQIKEYLREFDYIGVRDLPTRGLIESAVPQDKAVHMNCDPTFVWNFHTSKDVGKQLIKDRFGITGNKKCIALMLGNTALAEHIIETYKSEFDFISLYNYQMGSIGCAVLDPFEWTEAIAGADGLITEFFHGMVFALKNGTPFLSIEGIRGNGKEYSKAYDLLHRNGLDDHFFMLGNWREQTLREIGSFLADVLADKAEKDFRRVCEKEKTLFSSFIEEFPDLRPKHVSVSNKTDCCGCSACQSVCPTNSILMKTDDEGFRYPEVEQKTCIDCGFCREACTFDSEWGGLKDFAPDRPLDVFGVKHKNEEIRQASRSGGVFTALTDHILACGGTVYGVALNSKFLAEHRRADTKNERDRFRGSKYIQSDMGNVYAQIREDLKAGRAVFFSGTPCQVAAVRKSIKREASENLYLVDIICHGVPSPKVWRDYLDEREKECGAPVEAVDFRSKKFGWSASKETYIIKGVEYDSEFFTKLFYSHWIIRPSCFECKYKCVPRVGDITIADYWGIEKAIPNFNDDKGVSLVLINTEKGQHLFDSVKGDTVWQKAKLEDSMQNSLKTCYPEPAGRREFWKEYRQTGMSGYMNRIKKENRKAQVVRLAGKGKRFTKRFFRKVWKTIGGE